MEKLVPRVKSLHSYSVPEIVALPIIAGSERVSRLGRGKHGRLGPEPYPVRS